MSATPSSPLCRSVFGVLALAVVFFSGTVGAQKMNAKDCKHLHLLVGGVCCNVSDVDACHLNDWMLE